MTSIKTKVCLIVIDGWGLAEAQPSNAVTCAETPNMTELATEHLASVVQAHGLAVGLPDGIMGNSEVGHLTIGAGRVNFQDLERINFSIEDGTFFQNKELLAAFANAKATTGRLHLLGLLSNGGVHSHIDHLKQFLKAAKDNGVPETFVHAFGDGRDTAPRSGLGYIEELLAYMASINYGKIASICGRYFAMDRDKRWERVQIAYDAIVANKNALQVEGVAGLLQSVKDKYESGESDEFWKPVVVSYSDKDAVFADGSTASNVQDKDTVVFFNFRADRMREINLCFGMDELPFEKPLSEDSDETDSTHRAGLYCVQMTRYDSKYTMPVMYPPNDMRDGLSEWVAKQGLTQFHAAETEKYAHVTFFFNGGVEEAFPHEDRAMVASPKVATYDLQPEMNAAGVAQCVCSALDTHKYDLVLCNFAPPDMVGHTGVLPAAITAITATDKAIGEIMRSCIANNYTLAVTADHGNAEKMLNLETGNPHTAHTSNPVPFYVRLSPDYPEPQTSISLTGGLADVAPTILDLMGLSKPPVMTGHSLLKK